jgi:hypothetical protein
VATIVISGCPESGPMPGLTAEKLRDAVKGEVLRSSAVKYRPGGRGGAVLKVDLAPLMEAVSGGGGGARPPRVEISVKTHDEKGLMRIDSVNYAASDGELLEMKSAQSPEGYVASLVSKALSRLPLREAMRRSTNRELLRDLASADSWRREMAVDEMGSRGVQGEWEQVAQKLRDQERTVALKAVGALVALGRKEAVPALIDYARGKDSATQVQLMYAISQIGGPVAEGYLFVVSEGHQDRMVAGAAGEALDELEKRNAVPGKNASLHR